MGGWYEKKALALLKTVIFISGKNAIIYVPGMCIRASSLVLCQYYFLVSKTADILNYPQRQKATQKKKKYIPSRSFKHERIWDPPLLIGC